MARKPLSDLMAALLAVVITLGAGAAIFVVIFRVGRGGTGRDGEGHVAVELSSVPGNVIVHDNGPRVATQPDSFVAPDANLVARGQALFARSCVMCHGPAGRGVANLGNDLTVSEWVRDSELSDVVAVIRNGRMISDPVNRSKLPMPPKGGVPSLNEGQIDALAAYCKALTSMK